MLNVKSESSSISTFQLINLMKTLRLIGSYRDDDDEKKNIFLRYQNNLKLRLFYNSHSSINCVVKKKFIE